MPWEKMSRIEYYIGTLQPLLCTFHLDMAVKTTVTVYDECSLSKEVFNIGLCN